MNRPRIVLSICCVALLLVAAVACDAPDSHPGIGTSPSADDDPVLQPGQLDQVESPLVVPDAGPDAGATPAFLLTPPVEWRGATLRRALPPPMVAGFDWVSLLVILSPIIQTIVGKIFTSQVKDSNRRTEILGYADTAFQVVEALGPQLGLSGKDKYLRFVEQVVNSLKAAGKPEPTAQEMQLLKQLATDKAYLAKALPLPRAIAFPLPPPPLPRG